MSVVLPKPLFDSCDETSLKLKWTTIDMAGIVSLKLEYKEVHEEWTEAKGYNVPLDSRSVSGASLNEADVVDLNPGTPYFVRLAATTAAGTITGPETVFDTKPVDCGPKRRCTVS
mmetsp:Transcript_153/g.314  ORF Transcript_153/g.314 Transcript_153/m.314 type:complete len:115 (+) Transcript_153:95-439(+)